MDTKWPKIDENDQKAEIYQPKINVRWPKMEKKKTTKDTRAPVFSWFAHGSCSVKPQQVF